MTGLLSIYRMKKQTNEKSRPPGGGWSGEKVLEEKPTLGPVFSASRMVRN